MLIPPPSQRPPLNVASRAIVLMGPVLGLFFAWFLFQIDRDFDASSQGWRKVDFQFYLAPTPSGFATAHIIDFTAHQTFVRGVWQRDAAHPYTATGHHEIYQKITGADLPSLPATSYAPPFFLLYSPGLILPTGIAYLLWVALSMFAFGWAIDRVVLPLGGTGVLTLGCILLVTFSIDFGNTIYHGASAFLTISALLAGFSCLYDRTGNTWRSLTSSQQISFALLLVACAAKPNAALPLFTLALLTRQWHVLLYAGTGAMLICLVLAPRLGGWPDWIFDYLNLLSHYIPDQLNPYLSDSVAPSISTSLVAAFPLHGWISYIWLTKASGVLWLYFLAGIVIHGRKEPPRLVLFELISSFLLLSPSLTQCEDLLWIALPVCLGERRLPPWQNAAIAVLLVLILNLNRNHGMPPIIRDYPWAILAKLMLVAIVWHLLGTCDTPFVQRQTKIAR